MARGGWIGLDGERRFLVSIGVLVESGPLLASIGRLMPMREGMERRDGNGRSSFVLLKEGV